MAHPYRLIKSRVSRVLEQIMEMQGTGRDSEENATIEACVAILQSAQSSALRAIADSERRQQDRRQSVAHRPRPAPAAPVAATPAPAAAMPKDLVPEDPYDAPRDHHWHGQSGEPPAQLQHMPKEPRRHFKCATELARTDLDSHIVPLVEEADDNF